MTILVGTGWPPSGLAYKPQRLTWKGHEFLAAARDDTLWRNGKERLLGVVGGVTFDLLLAAHVSWRIPFTA